MKNFIEQHIPPFVPLPSAIFRQLHDSTFSKLLIFLSEELFHVPFTVFQGIGNFFIKIICKDWNKWKSEYVMSGEYGGWIRTSQPSWNSCCLVIRETCSLALFLWTSVCVFCWLILDVFHQVLLKVGLLACSACWNEPFDFPEGTHNRGLSSSLTIYFLWMMTGLWCSWW